MSVNLNGKEYNISLCYRSSSDDLIVFLHGLGCSKDSFQDVWNNKKFQGFSLLTFDLPGFGLSEKPDDFGFSMEEHAEVSHALLKHFPETRYHIVAHSMGGAVGILLAEYLRNSLFSFVNVEGNLTGDDCGRISRRTIGVSYEMFQKKMFPLFQKNFQGSSALPLSLDKASPLAFYRSSESLVAWSDSGKLLKKFQDLECEKVYFLLVF